MYEPGERSLPSGIFNNAFLCFSNLHKHSFLYSEFIALRYSCSSFVILFTHNESVEKLQNKFFVLFGGVFLPLPIA